MSDFSPPSLVDINAAVRPVQQGGVLLFPTETLYGLGCLATDAEAVARIYTLKNRAPTKPLPLLAANTAQVAAVADLDALPDDLAAFWPGPLTVILPARSGLSPALLNAHGQVAVRVTSHPLAATLAERTGVLTASSANRSGCPPARTPGEAAAILRAWGVTLPLLAGGPPPAGGLPSTIVEPAGTGSLRLLRQGAIRTTELEAKFHILTE